MIQKGNIKYNPISINKYHKTPPTSNGQVTGIINKSKIKLFTSVIPIMNRTPEYIIPQINKGNKTRNIF